MKKSKSTYEQLKALATETHTFQSILSLLHWDQETFMPKGSIHSRTEQISLLSTHVHELQIRKRFKELLEKMISLSSGKIKSKHLSKQEKVNLREWRKHYLRNTKLPTSFIQRFSKVTAEACQVWARAKEENDFKQFAPFLEKIVELSQEKASIYGFEKHPYNALISSYEPCMTTHRLDQIFGKLKKTLTPLLKKIKAAKSFNVEFLQQPVKEDLQMEIGKDLLEVLPLDENYSRLDISAHPFSISLHPHDSRITTRIVPNHFMSNIFSILHEVGHSLYEMGLPSEYFGSPMCEAVSLSVHESQSRFWETCIGKSRPFWEFYYPKLKKRLPKQLQKVSLDRFYKAIHSVKPSLIRVEADEVTYCLHIIIRYELEKELISGKLSVRDLPDAWNEKMQSELGILPPNDQMGCLQDVHWSLGDFGYFPTYALGNLMAAQLFSTLQKENPNWENQMQSGDFRFIRKWLHEKVHQWGKMYDLDQLVRRISSKPFSEEAYCTYLKKKYSQIYGL